jgi:hypothetical protein
MAFKKQVDVPNGVRNPALIIINIAKYSEILLNNYLSLRYSKSGTVTD